jgi:hypothetical protein
MLCVALLASFGLGPEALWACLLACLVLQRYISTRPMFTNLRELHFGAGAPAANAQQPQQAQQQQQRGAEGGPPPDQQAAAVAALRGLSSLYKSILGTMREEAVVMEQVFPSPDKALEMYIQRIFEQRVSAALGAALRPPLRDGGPAALEAHLSLLAEAFKKTKQLAVDLQVGIPYRKQLG